MQSYESLGERLASVPQALAASILLASVILNVVNVAGRSIFNAPIEWADEILLFSMVAIVFFAAGSVSWREKQIRMDIIIQRLPVGIRRIAETLNKITAAAVAIFIVWISVPVVHQLQMYGQLSDAAKIPMFIPQAAIPIGMALIAVATVARIILPSNVKHPALTGETPLDPGSITTPPTDRNG